MTEPAALSRRVASTTAVVWCVGVLAFAALSVVLTYRSGREAVDAELRAHALAVYGLAWFDEKGAFHDEVLLREPALLEGDVTITIATATGVVFGEDLSGRTALVDEAMSTADEVWVHRDAEQVLAIPTYDDLDRLNGAVIARRSTDVAREDTVSFALYVGLGALTLILLGLVTSRWIANRLLTALQSSLTEREQILAGAAHELRTPMATLRALADAPHPDPADTLADVRSTVTKASVMVDRLLTWSRLAAATPDVSPVRLDLMVEVCLEEDEAFEGEETVVLADPRLLEVAIRNLVENARIHGGGVRRATVRSTGRVEIDDHGDGIDSDELAAPFVKGPQSPGSGLGLALVRRIAAKHGGRLELRPTIALQLPVPGGRPSGAAMHP